MPAAEQAPGLAEAEPEGPAWPAAVLPYADPELPPHPPEHRTLLDPVAEAHLEAFGFAVIPFLSPAEAAALRSLYDELGSAPGDPRSGFFQGNVSTSVAWKRSVRAAVEPRVAERVAETFDDQHLFLVSYLVKWPGGGTLPPHVDPTMVDQEDRYRGATLWCPLDPPVPGVDDGNLRVVPGSHHLACTYRYRAKGGHAPSPLEPLEVAIDERYAIELHLDHGEAVVFDHRVIHHSRTNGSDRPRVVLGLAMHPAIATSVHLECTSGGVVSLLPIDDEYYIQNHRVGTLPYPVRERADRVPPPPLAEADLATLRRTWDERPAPAVPASAPALGGAASALAAGTRSIRGDRSDAPDRRRLARDGFVILGAPSTSLAAAPAGSPATDLAAADAALARAAESLGRALPGATLGTSLVVRQPAAVGGVPSAPHPPVRAGSILGGKRPPAAVLVAAIDDLAGPATTLRCTRRSHLLAPWTWDTVGMPRTGRLAMLLADRAVSLPLRAGQAVLLDPGTAVCLFANPSDAARRLVVAAVHGGPTTEAESGPGSRVADHLVGLALDLHPLGLLDHLAAARRRLRAG